MAEMVNGKMDLDGLLQIINVLQINGEMGWGRGEATMKGS